MRPAEANAGPSLAEPAKKALATLDANGTAWPRTGSIR